MLVDNDNEKQYRVVKTADNTFFTASGSPVNGYAVDIEFTKIGEIHSFNVETLDVDNIKALAEKFIEQRTALANL